jgi:hypothetical protein
MTENDYKLLDRYLAGELSSEEQADVNRRLAADADFAEAYEFRRATDRYLRTRRAEAALREQLAELGAKHFAGGAQDVATGAPAAKVRRLWPGLLALAAAVALLLLAWPPWGQADLYTRYADHPPLSFTTRGAASEALQKAETAWLAQDYEAAYAAFAQLPDSIRQRPQILLARGIVAVETERYGEAQLLFRRLSTGQSALRDYGAWYEALTMLKAGNEATARELLRTLEVSDPQLQQRIQALRNDLN